MNWSSSSAGSSKPRRGPRSAPASGASKTAAAAGSSTLATSRLGSSLAAATSLGSASVAVSSYGSVELVELPGQAGTSLLVVVAGVVAGVALLVPGGILLYGAVTGVAAATGGILATAMALAANYPVATAVGVGALSGAGFQALMFSIPGGDDWAELGKQILLGSIIGGVTGGVAAGAAAGVAAGYTVAARSLQGGLSFGLSEVTLQALIDASIVAAAAGVGSATATHLTHWVFDGDADIAQLLVDIGLNMVLSIVPIVGGGVAVRFCSSKAAVLAAAATAGAGASLLEPPETAGMAVLRASMGGLQSSVLGVHLHKVTQLFHVTKTTTVQYLPPNPGSANHGFNIYEPEVHGHVRTNHALRTATPTFGAEIHLKAPDGRYAPAPLALRQANVMHVQPEFVVATDAIRDAIARNNGVFDPAAPHPGQHKPMLQHQRVVNPQLQGELDAVRRACADGAAQVMREELQRALPLLGPPARRTAAKESAD